MAHGDPSLSTTMKSFAPLLALASVIVASPLIDSEQLPLDGAEHARFNLEELGTYPGVSLDLNERRLIELEDHRIQLATELDKVGFTFFGLPMANLMCICLDSSEGARSAFL